MLCGVCAAVSSVEMGFWVCGSGGGSSRARNYLQVRRAKRGRHELRLFWVKSRFPLLQIYLQTARHNTTQQRQVTPPNA